MSIFTKAKAAIEAGLDSYIAKAQNVAAPAATELVRTEHVDNDRKGFIEMDMPGNDQGLFRERMGAVHPIVLKNMARKDSIIVAIHQALLNQVSNFTAPQRDKYSPGFRFTAKKPADLTRDEKLSLSDPDLTEEDFDKLKFKLDKKRTQLQEQQDKDIEACMNFILHCGADKTETNTTYKRIDFDKFIKLVTRDRLTYNYVAIEKIPTKGGDKLFGFYPVSAGTIRYVAARDEQQYKNNIEPAIRQMLGAHASVKASPSKPYRYAQVLRGKAVAAWTEDDFIFEAANPTVDPEDYGYAQGELEWLLGTVTSHLYAEGHNRNFFTQGIGTKGILHIKGDIPKAQLEAFKRAWFAQLANTKNAFRPPVIGMVDEVKWVALTQSNREMEFQSWMEYLIKLLCAAYQIDPAEINFDITKSNSSTLNEASNEQRIKSSKNKGLRPLLMFLQGIINNQILPQWNKELADKYVFEFVGLDAETKQQEIDRLQKESQVYKTVNEIRNEQGLAPIDFGDVILSAAYTQFRQMQEQNLLQQQQGLGPDGAGGPNGELQDSDFPQDDSDMTADLEELEAALTGDDEESENKSDETKKSLTVEYHHYIKE